MLSKDFASEVSDPWTKSKASIKVECCFSFNVP